MTLMLSLNSHYHNLFACREYGVAFIMREDLDVISRRHSFGRHPPTSPNLTARNNKLILIVNSAIKYYIRTEMFGNVIRI